MTKALSPYEKKRKELLAEMTPPTREVALDFEKKLGIATQGRVLIAYDMGMRMKKVMADEATYGSNAAAQLAAYLGQKNTTGFYNLMNFATAFDREWVKREAVTGLSDGQQLQLGHFLALSQVKLPKDLDRLLTRTRQECLSVNDLEAEIKAAYEKKNIRSGGRKPGIPKSPMAGLQKSQSLAQQLSNYLEKFDDTVLPAIEDTPPDEIDEKVLARIEAAETQLVQTNQQVEATLRHMVDSKQHVQNVLANREKAAEASKEKAHARNGHGKPEVTKGSTPKGKSKASDDFADEEDETVPVRQAKTKKNKKNKKNKKKRPQPAAV